MFWMCIRIASVRFYGEILKIIYFYHFDSDPRFLPFLLYLRWKSGVNFVRRCFRDVLMQLFFDVSLAPKDPIIQRLSFHYNWCCAV